MTLPTLNLKTATPDEINAAVAEHVAGFARHGNTGLWADIGCVLHGYVEGRITPIPDYLTDANATLSLLSRHGVWKSDRWPLLHPLSAHQLSEPRMNGLYRVTVIRDGEEWDGEAGAFERAACIALLRASGKVTVLD